MMPAAMMESISLQSVFRSNSVIIICIPFVKNRPAFDSGAASGLLWFWWMIVLEDFPCMADRPDGSFQIFFGDFIQYLTEPGMILEAVEFRALFPQGSQLQP